MDMCFIFQVRTPEQKFSFFRRKKDIQDRFRIETGLLVDVVLQGMWSKFAIIILVNYILCVYIYNLYIIVFYTQYL